MEEFTVCCVPAHSNTLVSYPDPPQMEEDSCHKSIFAINIANIVFLDKYSMLLGQFETTVYSGTPLKGHSEIRTPLY